MFSIYQKERKCDPLNIIFCKANIIQMFQWKFKLHWSKLLLLLFFFWWLMLCVKICDIHFRWLQPVYNTHNEMFYVTTFNGFICFFSSFCRYHPSKVNSKISINSTQHWHIKHTYFLLCFRSWTNEKRFQRNCFQWMMVNWGFIDERIELNEKTNDRNLITNKIYRFSFEIWTPIANMHECHWIIIGFLFNENWRLSSYLFTACKIEYFHLISKNFSFFFCLFFEKD